MSDTATTAAELAVHIGAAVHRADPAALCDSNTFMTSVEQLGPDQPGFVARVTDAVQTAIEANPGYRHAVPAQQAEPSPAAPAQWTEEQVAAASGAEVNQALSEGLLRDLGFAPKRSRRH